jgi:hypothetical protein
VKSDYGRDHVTECRTLVGRARELLNTGAKDLHGNLLHLVAGSDFVLSVSVKTWKNAARRRRLVHIRQPAVDPSAVNDILRAEGFENLTKILNNPEEVIGNMCLAFTGSRDQLFRAACQTFVTVRLLERIFPAFWSDVTPDVYSYISVVLFRFNVHLESFIIGNGLISNLGLWL